MRFLLYIILSLCSCFIASAQIAVSLQYIHGDSIVMWSPDGSDFRSLGLHVDPELTSRALCAANLSTKESNKMDNYWSDVVCKQMDIVGGFSSGKKKCCPPSAAKSAQIAAMKFLAEPHAEYFDVVERILMNHAMRSVLQSESSEEKHALAQTLCDAAGWVYATRERDVFLNLYVNSTVRIVTDSLRMIIDQMTSLPHDNRVKIRISGLPRGKYPFTLKLRIPDWAVGRNDFSQQFAYVEQGKHTFLVYINGREENMKVEDGYMVISRKWNSGDEVFFDLPMPVRHLRRVVDGTAQRGVVALQRGPWIYCALGVVTGAYYVTSDPAMVDGESTPWGNVRLSGTCYDASKVPADAQAKPVPFYAVPYVEGVGQMWLTE